MTMKKALLATFSFGYTDAAVIFSENQFSYERQNITGWRIRSTSTGTGTTNSTTHDELWRIQNISFHTDRDCSPKSKVDLANAVLFSSTNGNNHHDTADKAVRGKDVPSTLLFNSTGSGHLRVLLNLLIVRSEAITVVDRKADAERHRHFT